MTADKWLKNTLAIASVFSFRMFGLFMLIPIFTLYAAQLKDATPALMGLALGGYGLSQGILQPPGDGDRPAQTDIQLGKLGRGEGRGRIDRKSVV